MSKITDPSQSPPAKPKWVQKPSQESLKNNDEKFLQKSRKKPGEKIVAKMQSISHAYHPTKQSSKVAAQIWVSIAMQWKRNDYTAAGTSWTAATVSWFFDRYDFSLNNSVAMAANVANAGNDDDIRFTDLNCLKSYCTRPPWCSLHDDLKLQVSRH